MLPLLVSTKHCSVFSSISNTSTNTNNIPVPVSVAVPEPCRGRKKNRYLLPQQQRHVHDEMAVKTWPVSLGTIGIHVCEGRSRQKIRNDKNILKHSRIRTVVLLQLLWYRPSTVLALKNIIHLVFIVLFWYLRRRYHPCRESMQPTVGPSFGEENRGFRKLCVPEFVKTEQL